MEQIPPLQDNPLIKKLEELFPGKLQAMLDFVIAENHILRSKFPKRVPLTQADREWLVRVGLPVKDALEAIATIVKPETILSWYRKMKRDKWTYNKKSDALGRPPKTDDSVQLVLRLAGENRSWGYVRIAGELKKLGHEIAPGTVRNIMKKHGSEPAPKRKGLSWKEFLLSMKQDRWATDFFTEEVLTLGGLVTCYVLFFINIATRKVYLAGCTPNPAAAWVTQQARNFSMWLEDTGMRCKYLIHDHETTFFPLDTTLQAQGIEIVKTPIQTPVCNSYAERFVREARETLDTMIVFGDRHLFKVTKAIEKHHNEHRPHQGLDNEIPAGFVYPKKPVKPKNVECVQALGGLLKHYYAKAA